MILSRHVHLLYHFRVRHNVHHSVPYDVLPGSCSSLVALSSVFTSQCVSESSFPASILSLSSSDVYTVCILVILNCVAQKQRSALTGQRK